MHNVLITGTSRGIGRETALLFLENGYTVYGLDREKGSIENENYHHLQCDVSDQQPTGQVPGYERKLYPC